MPARCHEANERKSGRARVGSGPPQEDGEQMPHQVVDPDEGFACGPSQPFGHLNSDEKCSDEARAVGHGDAVDLGDRQPGLREGGAHDGAHVAHVVTRCELRNDAAVSSMHAHLGMDDVGQNPGFFVHDRGGGFVARRLDP
jgi:hypothetical protein